MDINVEAMREVSVVVIIIFSTIGFGSIAFIILDRLLNLSINLFDHTRFSRLDEIVSAKGTFKDVGRDNLKNKF